MSIPIKAQLFGVEMTNGKDENWDGIMILCDGSYYGFRNDKMYAFSRSYTGQVIKQSLKNYAAEYHNMRYLANQAAKREEWDEVDDLRDDAALVREACVEPLRKLWEKFRSLKRQRPRKEDSRVDNKTRTIKNDGYATVANSSMNRANTVHNDVYRYDDLFVGLVKHKKPKQ